jgi:FdhD protein
MGRNVDPTSLPPQPLELRVNDESLTVTMRTPGHDVELAHELLLTEGPAGVDLRHRDHALSQLAR